MTVSALKLSDVDLALLTINKVLGECTLPDSLVALQDLGIVIDHISEQAALRTTFPDQPIIKVGDVVRFQGNAIVRHLLDAGSIDLNHIAGLSFSDDDRAQFAQLIGYSLSGYAELDYVSDALYNRAAEQAKAQGLIE